MSLKTYKILLDKHHKSIESYVSSPTKEGAYNALCLLRMTATRSILIYNEALGGCFGFIRRVNKANRSTFGDNIRIVFADPHKVNPYTTGKALSRKVLINIGYMMFAMLDEFQRLGGSFDAVCNLCNISSAHGREILKQRESTKFSHIVFENNLDYKNEGSIIENIPEAPFSICMKEYMLHQMTHTERGRQASDEFISHILPELFPELSESVVWLDESGEVHRYEENNI